MTELRSQRGDSSGEQEQPERDPGEGRWSNAELLLAVAVDELRMANWLYASAHSATRQKPPPQIPRPGVAGKKPLRPGYTLEQARLLDPRLRAEHEAQMRDKEGG